MSQPLPGHNNDMTSVLQTATGASYASGIAAMLGGLSLSDWLTIFGALMVLLTYLTNLWFRLDALRRERSLYELQRKQITESLEGDE